MYAVHVAFAGLYRIAAAAGRAHCHNAAYVVCRACSQQPARPCRYESIAPRVCSRSVRFMLVRRLPHPICDTALEHCFVAHVAARGHRARNASVPATSEATDDLLLGSSWASRWTLRAYYLTLLDGSCVHKDGSRKVIVDVGAGWGALSLYLATRGCFVHAVEALPVNARALDMSMRANRLQGRLFVHAVAVATAAGTARARYARDDSSTTQLVHETRRAPARATEWTNTRVRTVPLDVLVRRGGVGWGVPPHGIDLLRVDAHGSERAVLVSGMRTIAHATTHVVLYLDTRRLREEDIRHINERLEAAGMKPRFRPPRMLPWSFDQVVGRHRAAAHAVYTRATPLAQ